MPYSNCLQNCIYNLRRLSARNVFRFLCWSTAFSASYTHSSISVVSEFNITRIEFWGEAGFSKAKELVRNSLYSSHETLVTALQDFMSNFLSGQKFTTECSYRAIFTYLVL